jgi:hypothetical protein
MLTVVGLKDSSPAVVVVAKEQVEVRCCQAGKGSELWASVERANDCGQGRLAGWRTRPASVHLTCSEQYYY